MEIETKIKGYLTALCEDIGPRPTGTAANRAAVDYACKVLVGSGLAVRRQEFECMDWVDGGGELHVNGSSIPVVPAPYSLGCAVRGEVVRIGSLAELRETSIAGKIAVLYGQLAAEPLMPKSFVFWNPDEHKETISLLERGGPLAVLCVSLSAERFLPVIEDGDFSVPCGILLPESLDAITGGTEASLTLRADRKPARGANVIAAYGSGEKKVCFSAHIDTKPEAPGALDNASGVAVLLALASTLAGREFPFQIEFVLFNGEDYYSTPGETAYLATHLSKPSEYLYAFNIDGVGAAGRSTAYSFFECPDGLRKRIKTLTEAGGEFVEIAPWPQGDHTLFAFSGIPAVAVTSDGIFELADDVLHTARDRLDLIDPAKLAALVRFLSDSL